MATSYDVVVVGAGPAGSAAAFYASRGGRRVLLVDRSAFPREKTCGDAVSPRGLLALQRMGVLEPPGRRVWGARFVRQPDGPDWYEDFRGHDGPGCGSVVPRAELDGRLVAAARAVGADVVTAVARRVEADAGRSGAMTLEVGDAGMRVNAAAVVIATGSGGVRQLLPTSAPRRPDGWGIAARGYFASTEQTGRELRIFFPVRARSRLFAGYLWAFPVAERCWNIGVGVFRSPSIETISLRAVLREFLASGGPGVGLGNVRPLGPVSSAPIAVAPVVDAPPGVLAVGDAGGLANPFTGEGIAPALESGELAGRLLAEDLKTAGGRYVTEVANLFPGRAAMRPALSAIYARPGLFLGRGADAVTGPTGLVGGALRGLVWDTLPRLGATVSAPDTPPGLSALRAVLDGVLAAGRRMRPLFGELLAGIIADPRSGIGWSTAFAVAAASRLGGTPGSFSLPASGLLSVLEMVALVAALHRDLLPPDRHPGGGAWGRNTVALALADTLTAEALRRLYGSDARSAVPVAAVARRYLRAAAVDALGAAGGSSPTVPLLLAAAGVATGRPGAALPAWVCAAAERVSPLSQAPTPVNDASTEAQRFVAEVSALVTAWREATRIPTPADVRALGG